MSYTTILHAVRKQFGLSCNEYCVADMVLGLSSNPKSPVPGWCNASRSYLATELDLSRQSVITIIQKLVEKQLIEENESKHLRSTALFYSAVTGCKESLQGVKKLDTLSRNFTPTDAEGVKKLDTPCQETLQAGCKETLQGGVKKLDTIIIDNNNTLDNNSDNQKKEGAAEAAAPSGLKKSPAFGFKAETPPAEQKPPVADTPQKSKPLTLEDRREAFKENLRSHYRSDPAKYPADMYTEFINYWTESDGKKMRWEKEKVFEIPNRLAAWHRRNLEKSSGINPQKHAINGSATNLRRDSRNEPIPGTPFGKL